MGIRFLLGRLSKLLPKKKWMAMIGVTHQFVDYYISKALDSSPDAKTAQTTRRTLLANLIEQTQDRVEIRNQIFQGMMAAQDTTSVLLGNTFFLLSRHPDVWDRFRAEVLSLGDQELTFDTLKSMKLLKKILNECTMLSLHSYVQGMSVLINSSRTSCLSRVLHHGTNVSRRHNPSDRRRTG